METVLITRPTFNPDWQVSPRITELPRNTPIEGFSQDREVFVRGLLERIGLPLNRVSSVVYGHNTEENKDTLGTAHMVTGEVTFYKLMDGLPEVAQLAVGVHELNHVNSPFVKDNLEVYKSEENMKDAQENALRVASQTIQSGRYLNGYHKALHNELKAGKISSQRFVEETNAIMIELRFTDPTRLKQVLEAQAGFLNEQGDKTFENQNSKILEQIDKTLLVLMPQFKDRSELDNHIQNLKKFYLNK